MARARAGSRKIDRGGWPRGEGFGHFPFMKVGKDRVQPGPSRNQGDPQKETIDEAPCSPLPSCRDPFGSAVRDPLLWRQEESRARLIVRVASDAQLEVDGIKTHRRGKYANSGRLLFPRGRGPEEIMTAEIICPLCQHRFPASARPEAVPACPRCGAAAGTGIRLPQTGVHREAPVPPAPAPLPVRSVPSVKMCPECKRTLTYLYQGECPHCGKLLEGERPFAVRCCLVVLFILLVSVLAFALFILTVCARFHGMASR